MVPCKAWGLIALFAAFTCCAGGPARANAASLRDDELLAQHQRSLRETQEDVTSPDVALDGACAADIVQHCKHLLTMDMVALTARTRTASNLAFSSADGSAVVHQPAVTAAAASGKVSASPADAAGKAAGPQTQSTQASSADSTLGATQTQTSDVAVDAQAASMATASNTLNVAVGAQEASKATASNTSDVAAGAQGASVATASNTSDVAATIAAGANAGHAVATAQTAAPAAGVAANMTAGTTSSAASNLNSAAATTPAVGSASTTSGAGVMVSGDGNTTAAATQAASAIVADSSSQATQQQNQAEGQGAAQLQAQEQDQSQSQAADAAAAAAAAVSISAETGAGGSGATASGTATIQQTQQQQQQQVQEEQQQQAVQGGHRRHLLAGEEAGTKAVRAEAHAAAARKDEVQEALQQLGLHSSLSAAVMSSASAPLARCLRGVMHASEMSISPYIPVVADECKAEVRSIFIKRASDVRYDPPLLSACAHDVVTYCADVEDDTTAVLGCLKAFKSQLQPLCRSAVTVRQAAAAEDLSLDPDLQRSCGVEREALCLHAGWGNGAAQMCLLGHLRGSLPQIFSELIFPPEDEEHEEAWSALSAASSDKKGIELSAGCSAALVQRLIEEGEDIRFNFRLSAACAGDKQVFCRDVRPGGAAVLRCLEDHMDSPNMQEECFDALTEVRLLRSLDVRLDHTFVAHCAHDVRNLCGEDEAEQLVAPADEVAFGLSAPFECLRGRLDMVRDDTCRRHMYESVIAAFTDNRLDAGLMRGCHQEVAVLCSQHPARALECLQEKIEKFSRDDSPAVLKGKVSETCLSLVLERKQQAATDVAFLPDLMAACAREHATFCSAPELEGVRALDCLADHRTSPDFSDRCGEALRDYLAEAARDIRTMAGLQKDCRQEISTLCKGVQPGEGRVISCLRDQRANITGEMCRRQVMRLLGFLVEDHRMDAKLTAACTSDVQKYCGGVEAGDGEVHDCLRRSFDHLSPECRAAEEEVEQLEHEDVRLNPKLMRECPLAISTFCADVPPGDARVISCLQSNMDKGHFPPACRTVLQQLTDRATVKYSLNYRLRQECEEDAQRLCPEAVDELGSSRHSLTGTGGAHSEETTLACLARQPGELASACRAELQALVKLSLNRYRVGMPLTSQCDGDVMQRCQVDQVAAPFMQRGYVLSCLAKHAARLHKPCWELVSTMDEGQFKRAAVAESTAWQSGPGGGAVVDEKVLREVAADVRRELEPKLYSTVHEQVNRKAVVLATNMTGALVGSIAPKVNALMHTTLSLLMLTGVGLIVGLLAWRKFMMRGGSVLVVRKDGRV